MKKLLLALVVAAVAMIASPMHAQAATTTEVIPFETDLVVCNGDLVHLSGSPGRLPRDGDAIRWACRLVPFQPAGRHRSGSRHGTTFHATGLTRDISITTPSGGYTETFVNRFHIQATAGHESYIVSETLHITVTPDVNVTAFVDNFSACC